MPVVKFDAEKKGTSRMSERLKAVEESRVSYTISPRPGVRVYENSSGMIVIANFSEEHFEGDNECEHTGCSYVRIHPDDAPAVTHWIEQTAKAIER